MVRVCKRFSLNADREMLSSDQVVLPQFIPIVVAKSLYRSSTFRPCLSVYLWFVDLKP